MTADADGERLYVDDTVEDLARTPHPVVRVISFPKPGWVFLTSGVTTRSERVRFRPS